MTRCWYRKAKKNHDTIIHLKHTYQIIMLQLAHICGQIFRQCSFELNLKGENFHFEALIWNVPLQEKRHTLSWECWFMRSNFRSQTQVLFTFLYNSNQHKVYLYIKSKHKFHNQNGILQHNRKSTHFRHSFIRYPLNRLLPALLFSSTSTDAIVIPQMVENKP